MSHQVLNIGTGEKLKVEKGASPLLIISATNCPQRKTAPNADLFQRMFIISIEPATSSGRVSVAD